MNEQALAKKGQGVGSASERTRTSITAGLKRKLKDLMGEFSELRAKVGAPLACRRGGAKEAGAAGAEERVWLPPPLSTGACATTC